MPTLIFKILVNNNNIRKLICCIWTLCCMIESDRVSLGSKNKFISIFNFSVVFFLFLVVSYSTIREHFSHEPIDFEEKPIQIESLNERDIIVNKTIFFVNYFFLIHFIQIFLLLCAQQNVHLHSNESILHPYLLFSSSHLCTQQQKNWWQTAMEQM